MARIGSYEIDLINSTLYWSQITRELHEVKEDFKLDVSTAINFYKEGRSREIITKKVNQAINSNISFDVELQIITARGNERWIRAIGIPEIKNNVCIKLTGSFQDINAMKLAELELMKLNSKLEKQAKDLVISNSGLEQFGFIASHDLQEPLRVL